MDTSLYLQVADYIVLAVILLVSLGTGLLFAIKDLKNVNRIEYFLGGRRMSMLPVALSIFATFTSSITLIGAVTDFYIYGPMSNLITVGMAIGCICAMWVIVPVVYPLRLITLYEYFDGRFKSRAVRLLTVIAAMFYTLGHMSIVLLTPALGLQTGAGIPLWLSVGVIGLIGTVYTAIGGIKGVIWTDVFQCLVTFIGLSIIILKGYSVVGGVSAVLKILQDYGRVSYTEFSLDPRVKFTWWGTTFGFGALWFGAICNQSSLQRICAMKSLTAAKHAYLLASIQYILLCIVLTAMAWVSFAYYVHIRCDPVQVGFVKSSNQLSPHFVMHALRDVPAIGGIYMAVIFSGSLSTISSGINALAANTVQDFLEKPLRNFKESTITLITKIIVVFFGVLIIVLAYAANSLQGSLIRIAVSMMSGLGGAVLGIFLMGSFIPWTNKYGAICGGITAFVFSTWLTVGSQIHGEKPKRLTLPPTDMCFENSSLTAFTDDILSQSFFDNVTEYPSQTNRSMILGKHVDTQGSSNVFSMYDISHLWFSLITTTITLVIGVAISYCTKRYNIVVTHPKYIVPFLRKWWYPETNHYAAEVNGEAATAML